MAYLLAFAASLFLSIVCTWCVRNFAIAKGWVDIPQSTRHMHTNPVPRLGGIAIYVSFIVVLALALVVPRLLHTTPLLPVKATLALLGPALIVFALGLIDDLRSLSPYWKLAIEVVAATWLYAGGLGIHRLDLYSTHGVLRISLGLPLTIFWVLLITNAFNLIDGLDGLAAGSALFSTTIIFAISLLRHTSIVSLLAVTLAGAILGFLRYNFHPATIFLGDSGSLLIGFLLSALALAGSQKATTILAVAIPVLSFGLPILDVTLSVVRRFISSKPLFGGDLEHIHHKLMKRGLSHRDAVLVLYAVAAAFGLLSLMLLHGEGMIGFVFIAVGAGVWWGVQELKYLEFYELAATARRLRQRKRIMANNLRLRRAIESLLDTASTFSDICRILEVTLEPLDFSGVAFQVPSVVRKALDHSPLRVDHQGRLTYLWGQQGHATQAWELKLELRSRSGKKLGDFFIARSNVSEPLWLDINLIHNEFRAAISDVVGRVIGALPLVPAAQLRSGPVLSAKAATAGSK